jgi:hypothetical protein
LISKFAIGGKNFESDLKKYAFKYPVEFLNILITFPTISQLNCLEELLIVLLTVPVKKTNTLGLLDVSSSTPADENNSHIKEKHKKTALYEYNPYSLCSTTMSKIFLALPLEKVHNIIKAIEINSLDWIIEVWYGKLFKNNLCDIHNLEDLKKIHLWALNPKVLNAYPGIKRYTNLKIL